MRLILTMLLLWGGSFWATAQDQQVPIRYQFMHVSLAYSRLYFSPAYRNREMVKVEEYLGELYQLSGRRMLHWEAMSRLLTELSAESWEVVNMVADDGEGGSPRGAVYLLRRPLPAK